MSKEESFVAQVIGENRVSIPQVIIDILKIKKGTKVRIRIEVVRE